MGVGANGRALNQRTISEAWGFLDLVCGLGFTGGIDDMAFNDRVRRERCR